MSQEYKICTHPECEYDGKPQPVENFPTNIRSKDKYSNRCKNCIKIYNSERYKLKKEMQQLKKQDIYQFTTEVAWRYINGKSNKRLLTLFQINKGQLEKILKYEEVLEYHICKNCFRLKHFSKFHKGRSSGISSYCKNCSSEIQFIDEKTKLRGIKSNNSHVKYLTYHEQNLGYADTIRNNNGILEVRCAYCGEWFKPAKRYVRNRIDSLKGKIKGDGENRLYCSEQCKQECPIFKKTADQLIKEDMIRAGRISSQELNREVQPELRQLVFERDNYTCQKCDKHKNDLECGLHCHHTEGIRWNPLESADVDQCITVCVDCHKEIHKIPGCGYHEMRCDTEDMLTI